MILSLLKRGRGRNKMFEGISPSAIACLNRKLIVVINKLMEIRE